MVAKIQTVAFQGVDAVDITVQVQLSKGLPAFTIVGLPDKAVGESKERVRAALNAIGLALPPDRITINLAPADIQKEGSHYDLPIAIGLLVAQGILSAEEIDDYYVLGELGLDGSIAQVAGVLPAAIHANAQGKGIICPASSGGEAAWAGGLSIVAAPSLTKLMNHFKGTQVIAQPTALPELRPDNALDLVDIKGQELAKRALEITAAGGHNLLMVGPPGAGKSMLAARLPGILPELSPAEALEVSMIHSLAGHLKNGQLSKQRPYRDPHHSASLPALIGGGMRAKPGEISLAHHGVLFLDELPEFNRNTLEALRQPLETGRAVVARANAHITYPARVQLVAAMNPCRCGYLADASQACSKAPKCGKDYQAKLSGPLLDRIDLSLDVAAVSAADLSLPKPRESSVDVANRVAKARIIQTKRYTHTPSIYTNAQADGDLLMQIATPDADGQTLLTKAANDWKLSARAYHRVLRVARTIADLEGAENVASPHIAEALSFRRQLAS